jgi:hypothetical protein
MNKAQVIDHYRRRHDSYMGMLLRRLKEIRAEIGKDLTLVLLALHREEGDKELTPHDFEILRHYVENEEYHLTAN